MKQGILFLAGLVLIPTAHALPQQSPPQKDIDAAIAKGSAYLVNKYPKGAPFSIRESELIVYTLIHAELDPKKVPALKQGIEELINFPYPLKTPIKHDDDAMTYRISVRLLALHTLLVRIKNNTAYLHLKEQAPLIQRRIAESAQYLVDTQLDNGQWAYGGILKNTPVISTLTTGTPRPESRLNETASKVAWENASNLTGALYKLVPKFGADAKDRMTDLGKPVTPGKERGDNSNTQYGILGLIAAEMSGVEVPRTTWELTMKWFESIQLSDGGFGYAPERGAKDRVAGSMVTAGAVALAAAYKYMGRDSNKESRFQKAVDWLNAQFTVTDNPKYPGYGHLYYLYGLERVGAFSGMKRIGAHDWYAEGATHLLKTQQADGSWKGDPWYNDQIATAFAVLFLKRATTEIMIDSGTRGIDAK